MTKSCIVLDAQDLVRLNEGSKTQIMGELWRRYSESVERLYYRNQDTDDASSSSSTPASSKAKNKDI